MSFKTLERFAVTLYVDITDCEPKLGNSVILDLWEDTILTALEKDESPELKSLLDSMSLSLPYKQLDERQRYKKGSSTRLQGVSRSHTGFPFERFKEKSYGVELTSCVTTIPSVAYDRQGKIKWNAIHESCDSTGGDTSQLVRESKDHCRLFFPRLSKLNAGKDNNGEFYWYNELLSRD